MKKEWITPIIEFTELEETQSGSLSTIPVEFSVYHT